MAAVKCGHIAVMYVYYRFALKTTDSEQFYSLNLDQNLNFGFIKA
jgi:hypothetical protein